MQFFEFALAPARRRSFAWLFFYQVLWKVFKPARTARVEWYISNSWQDVSCTMVCSAVNLLCTESCWPTDITGAQALLSTNPVIRDVCFAMEDGAAEPWHPAKDAENTLCYWNPGSAPAQRCPVESVTPPGSIAQNKVIRRLCPCLNTSLAVDDCGLGASNPITSISPAPAGAASGSTSNGSGSTFSGSSSSSSGSGSTSNGNSQASQSQPSGVSTAAIASGSSGCNELCVAGFGGLDSVINGKYARSSSAASLWARQTIGGVGATIEISQSSGKWRFEEVTSGGSRVFLSESNGYAREQVLPMADTYVSPRSDYEIDFSCCGAGGNSIAPKKSDDKGKDGAPVALIVGLCAGFAVCSILATAIYLKHWSKAYIAPVAPAPQHYSREPPKVAFGDPETDNTFGADHLRHTDQDGYGTQVPITAPHLSKHAHVEGFINSPHAWSNGAAPIYEPRIQHTQVHSQPYLDRRIKPPLQQGGDMCSPPPFRNRYTDATDAMKSSMRHTSPGFSANFANHTLLGQGRKMSSTQPQSQGGWISREDRAAKEVDAALNGGTVMLPETRSRRLAEEFQDGVEVRLVGLDTIEPTWDGAEGVVDGYDPDLGMVRVRFPDGRTKSVSEQNCEPTSRIPSKRSEVLRSSAKDGEPAASSPNHRPHRGIMAAPQGTFIASLGR